MSKTSSHACIFCLCHRKLSKEHIFAEWLQQHVQVDMNQTLHTVSRPQGDRFMPGQVHDELKGRLFRPGSPMAQTLKCVCTACNNTWMSRLQEQARPLLMPMINGQWRIYTEAERRILAAWVAMTVMVIEQADPDTAQVPQAHRDALMAGTGPPDGWHIYYALYTGENFNCRFHHRAGFLGHIGHRVADIPEDRRLQVTTFAVGKVIFAALSAPSSQLLIRAGIDTTEFGKAIRFAPLWPRSISPLVIAPLPLINDYGARAVADQFGYIPMAPEYGLVNYSARKRIEAMQARPPKVHNTKD